MTEFSKPNPGSINMLSDSGQAGHSNTDNLDFQMIDKDLIHPSKDGQVRNEFNEKKIAELRDSIREVGQIEAILVEADQDGSGFTIVAGERRWRAIKGIDSIQQVMCIIRDFEDEKQRYAVQLAENFDREDLSVVDKAKAISKLVQMHGGDMENAAKSIGKSRSTLIKMSSVLALPEKGKQFVDDGYTTDYSSINMLKTLFKIDEVIASRVIDNYRTGKDDRPIRETLRAELDSLQKKKAKPTRQKQQSITANEIYMQDKDDKLYIIARGGITTVKLDKLPNTIRIGLFDLLSNENNHDDEVNTGHSDE